MNVPPMLARIARGPSSKAMAMPKPRPANVKRQRTRHGKLVWYYRHPGGGYTRLPDLFGTDEWWAAYEDAKGTFPAPDRRKRQRVKPGTFETHLAEYLEDHAFTRYAVNTRNQREGLLRAILSANPSMDTSEIDADAVRAGMKRRDPHPANEFLKALRAFFVWAVENGKAKTDPTAGIKKLTTSKPDVHAWTAAERERFMDAWPLGTMQRLAYAFMWEGFRISDAATFCPLDKDDDGMVEKVAKKSEGQQEPAPSTFQISDETTEAIWAVPAATTATKDTNAPPYLRSAKGIPFKSTESARTWFVKAIADAGLPKRCTPHGLRRARAVHEAEAGATAHQLMTRFGWKHISEAQTYTNAAERRKIAREAARNGNRKSA